MSALDPIEPCGSNRLPVLAAQIVEAHDVVGRSMRCAVEAAVEAGNRLNEAKGLLPHGQWIPWLQRNVPGLNPRTAQRYMRAADAAAKNDTVSFSTIKALIAKPKPLYERWARLNGGLVLVLTPSTHPGHTHFSVIDTASWEVHGFARPVRDDWLPQMLYLLHGAAWPQAFHDKRVAAASTSNPHLAGALPDPDAGSIALAIEAVVDRRLDELEADR